MRVLLVILAVLLGTRAGAQITPVPGNTNLVLHLPGTNPNTLQLLVANATGGTFTATLNGATTAPIAYNATPATVDAALEAAPGMAGKISVGGEAAGPWWVSVATSVTVTSSSASAAGLSGPGYPAAPTATFATSVGSHVDHGRFWGQAVGTDLGSGFWWTTWVKPLNANYLVSDGYGGSHALLWGIFPYNPATGGGGASGNIWSGSAPISFTGGYAPAAGEWMWAAVGWDGTNIYTYANGICDGQTPGLTSRALPAGTNGHLYVGGSDHNNGGYDLAYLAAWDRTYWTTQTKTAAVWPSRFPRTYQVALGQADFAAEYVGGQPVIQDVSAAGYEETAGTYPARRHPGRIVTSAGASQDDNALTAYSAILNGAGLAAAVPRYISDATCPYARSIPSPLPKERVWTPKPPPGGCLIFDGFDRRNQTPAFTYHPTLGQTEGGSLGKRTWAVEYPDSWGILGGRAVLTKAVSSLSWVDAGTADQDVRVTRLLGAQQTGATGIAFRVKDRSNHWIAYSIPGTNNVYVYSWVGGVLGPQHLFTTGSTTWTILRIVAHGGTITPQVSVNGTTWIVDPSPVTDSVSDATWTGAGVSSGYHINSSYISSLERCDDFTVFPG